MKLDALDVRLVHVHTSDGWRLDAAWHDASGGGDTAALVLHGKTGNFYSGPSRFVSAGLAVASIPALALNMRCHDLGYGRGDKESGGHLGHEMAGGAWERLSEGHLDIAAAIAWQRTRGFRRIVLVGHSSGGWYSADYAPRDPAIAAFIFISPLLTNRTAIPGWFPTQAEQDAIYMKASSMIVDGQGHLLLPLPRWYFAISAQSLVERMDEAPGHFDACMAAVTAPVLMLTGGRESRVPDWIATTDRLPTPHKRYVEIPGSEHNFVDFEDQVVSAITAFLEDHNLP